MTFSPDTERILESMARGHYPTTKSDAHETWLTCACGWQSSGKPWKEGWQEHNLAVLRQRLGLLLDASAEVRDSLVGLWKSDYETRRNPHPEDNDPARSGLRRRQTCRAGRRMKMEYKGVKLCGEVQQFQTVVGNLLSFYCPPNTLHLNYATRDVRACISALFNDYCAKIKRNYPDGEPGSIERKRHNWSISQLKRDQSKFLKESHDRLKGNIWRG